MIGISKLYCGTVEPLDVIRYESCGQKLLSHLPQYAAGKKPVVVWNCTRRCNLRCKHCYSASTVARSRHEELDTGQAGAFLEGLADFGVPVILFSGGEPLLRDDLFVLISRAVKRGLRVVISTNGTLIEPDVARRLKEAQVSYVGVSLDGTAEVHDSFRGAAGSFQRAMAGIRSCLEAGLKVGVRFTINRDNAHQVPRIFSLARTEGVQRICFYHLVYAGRGKGLMKEDLSHQQTRAVVDQIMARTAALHKGGYKPEVLTVDNHADGPYLYLRMKRENHGGADRVLKLLKLNGGNSSGLGIGCVSWDGSVHPDQFWRHHVLGNVKRRSFSRIWTDTSNPLMARLKRKKDYVNGRCSRCRFLDICGGNCRARAEAATGDMWAPDPACYLRDSEIGLK